jgi:hypothetical protein
LLLFHGTPSAGGVASHWAGETGTAFFRHRPILHEPNQLQVKYQGLDGTSKRPTGAELIFLELPMPKSAPTLVSASQSVHPSTFRKNLDFSHSCPTTVCLGARPDRFWQLNHAATNVRLAFRSAAVLAQKA